MANSNGNPPAPVESSQQDIALLLQANPQACLQLKIITLMRMVGDRDERIAVLENRLHVEPDGTKNAVQLITNGPDVRSHA
jgi:hypothetical protein